eukprot:481078-Pleurochrysis_carterae.AAC.6
MLMPTMEAEAAHLAQAAKSAAHYRVRLKALLELEEDAASDAEDAEEEPVRDLCDLTDTWEVEICESSYLDAETEVEMDLK